VSATAAHSAKPKTGAGTVASEYRDVVAAGRWLAKRPDVDASRIGIWGGSYGGLLTAQALARNSDLFAAGVAVHGLFDWSWPSPRAFHLNPSDFFGVSEPTRARAFASSPLAAVDQWRSPVLLFSGDMDANVDVAETVDLAQKLRAPLRRRADGPGAGRGAWVRPECHLAKAVAGADRLFRRKARGAEGQPAAALERHSRRCLKAFLA
jgi:dienelactone hydrolase